jgi:Spy/CpxP family protein refolding chaperone
MRDAVWICPMVLAALAMAVSEDTPSQRASGLGAVPGGHLRRADPWSVVARFDEERRDPAALALHTLRLSDEQRGQLMDLSQKQVDERDRVLEEMRRRHAAQVAELLTGPQKGLYDDLVAALDDLDADLVSARDRFLAVVGPGADVPVSGAGYLGPIDDAARMLDVGPEIRAELLEARGSSHLSLGELVGRLPDLATLADAEAWAAYRQAYREARELERERYEARLRELLTPEQIRQLAAIEEAAAEHRRSVEEAWERAYGRVGEVLDKQGED